MKRKDDYFIEALERELENRSNLFAKTYRIQEESKQCGFEIKKEDKEYFIEEIGDGFFVLINLARFAGITPQELVHEMTKRYLKRMAYIEEMLKHERVNWHDKSLDELIWLWNATKDQKMRADS